MKESKAIEFVLPTRDEIEVFRRCLRIWYSTNGRKFPWRKKRDSNYHRIIAEVLLQRSRAETVAAFYPLFIDQFPSWSSLASTTEAEIAKMLQPIGLWRRRASSLLKLAKEMKRRNGRFPKNREEIETLPGVGQYIANAVLLFVHGDPQPLLDVNMARVLERYYSPRKLADIRYDPYLQRLAKEVVDCKDSILLNWAILDLASIICTAKSMKHHQCCLQDRCRYFLAERSTDMIEHPT